MITIDELKVNKEIYYRGYKLRISETHMLNVSTETPGTIDHFIEQIDAKNHLNDITYVYWHVFIEEKYYSKAWKEYKWEDLVSFASLKSYTDLIKKAKSLIDSRIDAQSRVHFKNQKKEFYKGYKLRTKKIHYLPNRDNEMFFWETMIYDPSNKFFEISIADSYFESLRKARLEVDQRAVIDVINRINESSKSI